MRRDSNPGPFDRESCLLYPLDRTFASPCFLASESYLAIDDDWAVDWSSQEGVAEAVEVDLQRGGRVADGDTLVSQAWEGFLGQLHNLGESHEFLDLDFGLLLVDVDDLDLAIGDLHAGPQDADELLLLFLDGCAYK